MKTVCVAFKAHQGWVNSVAIDADSSSPAPLLAQRIELSEKGDREVTGPFHVAGGWHGLEQVPRPQNPGGVISRGCKKQVEAAKKQLVVYLDMLEQSDLQWTHAVVLTGRGILGGDLEHILGSHAHIHIAEGEAVRSAIRAALDAININYVVQDEKSILTAASRELDLGEDESDNYLKELKPVGTKSWRKEERLIALGAWLNRKHAHEYFRG